MYSQQNESLSCFLSGYTLFHGYVHRVSIIVHVSIMLRSTGFTLLQCLYTMLQNISASKIKQSRVPMFLSRNTTIHGVHFQQRILSKQSQRYRKKLDENRFQQRGAPIVRSKSIVHSRPSTRNPLLIPFNYNRTPFI